MNRRTTLRRPWSWAALSAATLLVAAAAPKGAPDALFWGAIALSCAAAGVATWLRG